MKKQTLGMMISTLRKEKGMTQLELAEKMGVTDKAVSKWERDLSFPDINSIPKLAEIFEVSVDELMQVKTETKENIDDMCYWAWWMIYEEMVYSTELLEAGSVIFAPEGTENKRNGFWENKRKSKRVLIDDWFSIPKEKKNNLGRRTLRRYMALMANKKLRSKIFGF